MRDRICKGMVILICFLWNDVALGQVHIAFKLPEIALVDVEPQHHTLELVVEPPIRGGEPIQTSQSSKRDAMWLNYTSAIAPGRPSRRIVAQISKGTIPDGVQLYLEAKPYRGNGQGDLGHPSGVIALGRQGQSILQGIRGGFTGDGPYQGHQLVYWLEIEDLAKVNADKAAFVEIVFTITE